MLQYRDLRPPGVMPLCQHCPDCQGQQQTHPSRVSSANGYESSCARSLTSDARPEDYDLLSKLDEGVKWHSTAATSTIDRLPKASQRQRANFVHARRTISTIPRIHACISFFSVSFVCLFMYPMSCFFLDRETISRQSRHHGLIKISTSQHQLIPCCYNPDGYLQEQQQYHHGNSWWYTTSSQ